MTRILVCEDEPLIAKRLMRFIQESVTFPYEIDLAHTQSNAFETLASKHIDLLFLDLNLHGRDGFDILKQLTSNAFHTIVVSAHSDRAIEAFEIGVLDFIAKPFTQQRVRKALDRYHQGTNTSSGQLKYLAIQTHKGLEFVSIERIRYIKASGIYSELFLVDDSTSLYNKPLNQLLKLLPSNFIRTHKSYVTRIDDIASLEKRASNTYDALLNCGSRIPVSRSARKEIIEKLTV